MNNNLCSWVLKFRLKTVEWFMDSKFIPEVGMDAVDCIIRSLVAYNEVN